MPADEIRQKLGSVAATAPKAGPSASDTWFAQDEASVVAAFETDADRGLSQAEAGARLSRHGPNQITGEKPPSVWEVALEQLREPMNIMLIAVTAVSFAIGEVPTDCKVNRPGPARHRDRRVSRFQRTPSSAPAPSLSAASPARAA
jgi:magnesium-transporting ATPase (P-type)